MSPVLSCLDPSHHTLGSTNISLLDGLAPRAADPLSPHSFICKMGATLVGGGCVNRRQEMAVLGRRSTRVGDRCCSEKGGNKGG